MIEHQITRRGELSAAGINAGIVTLPEGVSFIAVPGRLIEGEFPHVPMFDGPDPCPAALAIHVRGGASGGHTWEPWCTRGAGHPEPHVAHLQLGQPIAAWTDEERQQ